MKTPYPSEHAEQVEFMYLLATHIPEIYAHTTAIPNGGKRHLSVAKKLKAEGVKKGYPDLLIDLPRGRYHGARFEMKRQYSPPSKTTREQLEWLERLNAAGYYAMVVKGAVHAFEQAAKYYSFGEFNGS